MNYPYLNPAAVAVCLADAGFRGRIKDRCLSMLTRWAQDQGLRWVIEQVFDDTGLTVMLTADTACGLPRFSFILWETREQSFVCQTCGAAENLLYFQGEMEGSIAAFCDRCHIARGLKDVECLRCGHTEDLAFIPIEDSEFGIYLCPTCRLGARRSPANEDFWADAEVISVYTDEMAVEDGVLIDLEALGVKADYKGLPVNRMTSHLFHQLRNMTAGMHDTVEDPVLAAELEALLKTKVFFAKDADGDGFLITLPGGSDDNPLWLVRNEVGGYTAMFASDY